MEKYRKIKRIGIGSFGQALLVQSVVDRKCYVMKIINVGNMDKKQKQDALNEVRVLKAMRHPYIITYRESFMDKKFLCIVMDYADGGDMYKKIEFQKKISKLMPENQLLDWFVQMALAIKHIHDNKILHRDLKTQNIFMTSTGEIKIGDFGIARVLQHTYDWAKTAIGTPYYLSPEICQEMPYNQKSDVWSLGCILYEMVTLRHAFDSNSMKGLVLKILRGNYPEIPSHYSQDLKDLISEMLIKDPAKRPSIRKIVEKDFLWSRISQLLTNTVAKHEFSDTFLKKHIVPYSENKENDDESESSKKSTKKSSKKKYPDEESSIDKKTEEFKLDTSIAKEKSPILKESQRNQGFKGYFNYKKAQKSTKTKEYEETKENIEDDSGYEEKEAAIQKFLQGLPGVTATDSQSYRIEALRVYLEENLGETSFIAAYKHLMNMSEGNEDVEDEIEGILGEHKMKFCPLIYQLIVCEDTYYNRNVKSTQR